MTMSTFRGPMRQTDEISGFKSNKSSSRGPKQADYLASIAKVNNPNVGPGSYDPIFKPKLSTTINTDWSRQPTRFKDQANET